jgi:hypothetical protein
LESLLKVASTGLTVWRQQTEQTLQCDSPEKSGSAGYFAISSQNSEYRKGAIAIARCPQINKQSNTTEPVRHVTFRFLNSEF